MASERGALDRTRERSAALNQLMFGVVALLLAILVVLTPFPGHLGLFFVGVVLMFAATGATLLIPWNRIPLWWLAIIPLTDALAIMIMRLSSPSPSAAFGLLWVFPVMWLSSGFGLVGLIVALLTSWSMFAITLIPSGAGQFTYSVFLFPLVLAALGGVSYLNARRSAAQQSLLDKQARLLAAALERARRQEQAVTEVLDAVDFGVIRIGPSGGISVTNDAHARLQHALGGEAASEGEPAFREDGVTPMPPGEMPLERALRGEAVEGQVVWFGDPGAERVALSVSVRRLKDGHGADAGAVLISRDVTTELTALRARDDLVASVSHELRTPLTSILGYLDLAIDDENVPASARRGLEIAERNAERLLGIVADILAASSASKSSVELAIHPEDIDVADVLFSSAESLLPRAAERAVTLDSAGIESAPAYADPKRLRQVVDNLIANAIKFNRDGGQVTVGCTNDGDSTFVLVRDTGLGMSEEEMAGLFERFYRAQSLRGTGRKGTGLGLAISRELVRAHGGDISVRSSPGVGSTFIVRLPATRAAAAPAPHIPAREAGPRRRGSAPAHPTHSPSEGQDA
jgi:signal transduction histidine kinase